MSMNLPISSLDTPEKLYNEREYLTRELQLLRTAMPHNKAAEKLLEHMSNVGDPMLPNSGVENEWVTQQAGSGDGCCTVM